MSLTANVYGQLRASEVHNSMVGMDWLGHDGVEQERQTWRALTDFLYEPYSLPRNGATPESFLVPPAEEWPEARPVKRARRENFPSDGTSSH